MDYRDKVTPLGQANDITPRRESLPLVIDESYKILCEGDSGAERILQALTGEGSPLQEGTQADGLMHAAIRNRKAIYDLVAKIKAIEDLLCG